MDDTAEKVRSTGGPCPTTVWRKEDQPNALPRLEDGLADTTFVDDDPILISHQTLIPGGLWTTVVLPIVSQLLMLSLDSDGDPLHLGLRFPRHQEQHRDLVRIGQVVLGSDRGIPGDPGGPAGLDEFRQFTDLSMGAILHPDDDGIESARLDVAEQPLVFTSRLGDELRGAESVVDVNLCNGPAETLGGLPAVILLAVHSEPKLGAVPRDPEVEAGPDQGTRLRPLDSQGGHLDSSLAHDSYGHAETFHM